MPFEVAYARFAYKADHLKLNVTAYTSGKAVIAGKGTEDFVRDTLEPEVIGAAQLGYDEVLHPDWFESHAGLDESGKGDFFGPSSRRRSLPTSPPSRPGARPACRTPRRWPRARSSSSTNSSARRTARPSGPASAACRVTTRSCCGRGANLNRLLAWQHATARGAGAQPEVGAVGPARPVHQAAAGAEGAREEKHPGLRAAHAHEGGVGPGRGCRHRSWARAEFVRQMHALSKKFGAKLAEGRRPAGEGAGAGDHAQVRPARPR